MDSFKGDEDPLYQNKTQIMHVYSKGHKRNKTLKKGKERKILIKKT